mmetsp:Transcript_15324/g.19714  ORF Transcript_15324/g.19714 Transcript_15324/m.19714 type:complete len:152 (-) Transcript_15324:2051-2506(-)
MCKLILALCPCRLFNKSTRDTGSDYCKMHCYCIVASSLKPPFVFGIRKKKPMLTDGPGIEAVLLWAHAFQKLSQLQISACTTRAHNRSQTQISASEKVNDTGKQGKARENKSDISFVEYPHRANNYCSRKCVTLYSLSSLTLFLIFSPHRL